MRKVFVAYDFESGGTLPTDLQTISTQEIRGLEVSWPGDSVLESPGQLWERKVKPGIEECDRLLAFGDLPNANVGFEIGYALGKKKKVGIACSRSHPHRWLKKPPFRGEFVQRLENVDEIIDFVCLRGWPESEHQVGGNGTSVLFLCPGKSGAAFRKFREQSWILPDQENWNIRSLERIFDRVGLVVWVISPHNDGTAGRDGPENAALSVLAGFAEGHPNLELVVLRSRDAREVADVASHEYEFETIEQFKNLLLLVQAGWEAPERFRHKRFRDWLPNLMNTPAFSGVDFGSERKGGPSPDSIGRGSGLPNLRKESIPNRKGGFSRVIPALAVFTLGIVALGAFDYFARGSSKIVYGEEIPAGVVVRLKADNFESRLELKGTVGEMGDLKIRIPNFEIKEEFRDTDRAPKVFLEVIEPADMVFEEYSWDVDEKYRSKSPWPIPHYRNRINSRLITKGEWDQNKFEKATDEVLRHLADLEPADRADLVEKLLEKSDLTLEALRNSVSEKKLPGLSLEDAVQNVDQGKIVAEAVSQERKEPLTEKEKEALTAVVACTGALTRTSDQSTRGRTHASGLVVGDHFVFTSPSVLSSGFAPETFPAALPAGDSLEFSLAEQIEKDRDPLVVQDVVAIHPEYVVLMVPRAGRRVRNNLEAYFSRDTVDSMLSKDFVFLSPGQRDEKCVAIGYPVATEATPRQFQRLLALSTRSGFQPRKRISVGRVYTSNPVWSTHTATSLSGSEGGPVAVINENEVGLMGFNQGGSWLGEGYQLSATYNLGSSSPGNRKAIDLVKQQIMTYAEREIDRLPPAMHEERSVWKAYFKPTMGVYELRKKLAELRITVWAFHRSANGPGSYELFRNGWMEFRNAGPRKTKHYEKSIRHFEHLLQSDPQYALAWLRLGEAYDKTLQRLEAYETLKRGYEVFQLYINQSSTEDANWAREIEASFLNTLFLVCKILGKQEPNSGEAGDSRRDQFEREAEQYFFLLQKVCPYHPTLVGQGR